ncbi:hypothetical protein MOTE_00210 [Moorella thermoacetica]|uniref:Uncharacterized protein n=1 Tax=Neomoorella thermoacetica TaxID=1525 RepID=A0A1J5NRS9_NEOTH|nr:hypothetical protein MOTE_00210 [Moorella thermoacetica]
MRHGYYLVFQLVGGSLVLADYLGFKLTIAVPGNFYLYLTRPGFNRFAAVTITVIPGAYSLRGILGVAKVVLHFGFKDLLNGISE